MNPEKIDAARPKLSIVLPAMLGYQSVAAAIDAWERQSCRDQLELIVVCPGHLGPTASEHSAHSRQRVIVNSGTADLHVARAMGIDRASGDYVMLAEDHCLPDPDWTPPMLKRMEEGWDAIGPELRAGNRTSCWTEGSFLIGYGEWMAPAPAGTRNILCGWNVLVRTELLRETGTGLSEELLLGAFLIRRLAKQGRRFFLEPLARMRHFDPAGCFYELFLLLLVGLGFGAMRTRRWPIALRLLYPLALPAIAFLHWKRAFVQYRRTSASSGMRLSILPAAFLLACSWAIGEALGALAGVKRVSPYLWRTEVKPVQPVDVARSAAEEEKFSSPGVLTTIST